jgi:tRNA(Ile2) C34 agmatinyltransferase TiaS
MKFTFTIECENSAFSGLQGFGEVARLLRQTADRVEQGQDCGRLTESNGNGCGSWDLEPTEEYRCDDCGTLSTEEHEGQVCRECCRGIISEGF